MSYGAKHGKTTHFPSSLIVEGKYDHTSLPLRKYTDNMHKILGS
jgi:hypothetical protein